MTRSSVVLVRMQWRMGKLYLPSVRSSAKLLFAAYDSSLRLAKSSLKPDLILIRYKRLVTHKPNLKVKTKKAGEVIEVL